jgi:hypothetical protein
MDHAIRRSVLLLAALAAGLGLAFVSAARADASTQLINAGLRQVSHVDYGMEVLADGTNRVVLRPSNPSSFRQQWEKEPFGVGYHFRNVATNTCLITGSAASENSPLRVGSCSTATVGNRNLWFVFNPVKFNGAGQPVNVQTGEAPLANFNVNPSGLLLLHPHDVAAMFGPMAEFHGM